MSCQSSGGLAYKKPVDEQSLCLKKPAFGDFLGIALKRYP
jgi:hypothetical protein